MIIKIDFDKTVCLARKRAAKMLSNGLYSRFGLSEEERIEKASLGCIGELGFEEYLKSEQIPYKLDNTNEFDFLIYDKKIDVKVAKKSTRKQPNDKWAYGYPEEQKPKAKDFVIVGWVDCDLKQVGFYGWITGKKISTFKVVTHNTFARYKYLTPNHEFKWGDMKKDFKMLLNSLRES